MEKDTEKSIQQNDLKLKPIFKRKSFIIGSIAFVALIGAVIFSITFGKHNLQTILRQCVLFEFFGWKACLNLKSGPKNLRHTICFTAERLLNSTK